MGCYGEREKLEDARAEQKWGYIVSTVVPRFFLAF